MSPWATCGFPMRFPKTDGHGIPNKKATVGWNTVSARKWTMWGPRSIDKLVNITPITMVYGTYNELVTGANLNQRSSLGGLRLKELLDVFFLLNHHQAQASFLTARRQGVRHGHRDYDTWFTRDDVGDLQMVWKAWIHNSQLHPGWWWLEPWNFMTFHILGME